MDVPVRPTVPTISFPAQVGDILIASGGNGVYQWYNEGAPISGATSSSYVAQGTDQGCLIQVLSAGIFSAMVGPVLGATVFYVSSSTGNDSNPGTLAAPWKTLAKVNAQTFSPGTSILFKRGDIWRNDGGVYAWGAQLKPTASGTSTSPIVFDAYGTGANPIIDGSFDGSKTSAWTNIGTNLWQSVQVFAPNVSNGLPNNQANDIGNVLWNFSAVGGANVPLALKNASTGIMTGGGAGGVWFLPGDGTAHLTAQGHWNFNTDNNRVQIYSVGNPATAMPGLILAVDTCCIYAVNCNWCIFQNLTMQYCAAVPFMTQGTCTHITVRDSVVQWYGGGNISGASSANSRYGDGIDWEGSIQFGMIERNWIHQGYDVGYGPQCGPGTAPAGHQDSVVMRNCVVTACNSGYSTFQLGGGTMNSADICNLYNNTIFGNGNNGSWSNGQRPNTGASSTNVVGMAPIFQGQTNLSIKNNIFAGIGGAGGNPGFGIDGTGWNNFPGSPNQANPYTSSGDWLDFNCWPKNTNGNISQRIALHSGNFNIKDWRNGTNTPAGAGTFSPALEVNGVFDLDPLFTNQSAFDFSLQSGSPCRYAGTNLFSSGVVWDFNKKPRPSSGSFSMGAFSPGVSGPPVNTALPLIPGQVGSGTSSARSLYLMSILGVSNEGMFSTSASQVLADAQYLNLSLWRDTIQAGAVGPVQTAIGGAGIKFIGLPWVATDPVISDMITYAKQMAAVGDIVILEGPNEPMAGGFTFTYNSVSSGTSSLPLAQWQHDMYVAVRADPVLKNIPIATQTDTYGEIGNYGVQYLTVPTPLPTGVLSAAGTVFADIYNMHLYPLNTINSGTFVSPTGNAFTNIEQNDFVVTGLHGFAGPTLASMQLSPRIITEAGFQAGTPAPGGYFCDRATQAKGILNGLINAYIQGFEAFIIYTNYDQPSLPGFGLMSGLGTPTTSGLWLHNFTTPLVDSGATANTFPIGFLSYTISGLPSTGASFLFQKSNGIFELVIWNNVETWNFAAGTPITTSAVSVTVTFSSNQGNLSVYDPTVGDTPISSVQNATSVMVQLADYPIIIEVSPVAPKVGVPLTVSTGAWTNSPTSYAYLWNGAGSPVNGSTYTPVTADIGHTLMVTVTASNSAGSSLPAASWTTSPVSS